MLRSRQLIHDLLFLPISTMEARERNLDAQLCRDLNPAARDVVAKHLSTTPRESTVDYS